MASGVIHLTPGEVGFMENFLRRPGAARLLRRTGWAEAHVNPDLTLAARSRWRPGRLLLNALELPAPPKVRR